MNFYLDEYTIKVNFAGQDFWVMDVNGNIISDEDQAFRFHKMGAERIAAEKLPGQDTVIKMVE